MMKLLKLVHKHVFTVEKLLETFMKMFGRYPSTIFRIRNDVKYPISSFCAELGELTELAL